MADATQETSLVAADAWKILEQKLFEIGLTSQQLTTLARPEITSLLDNLAAVLADSGFTNPTRFSVMVDPSIAPSILDKFEIDKFTKPKVLTAITKAQEANPQPWETEIILVRFYDKYLPGMHLGPSIFPEEKDEYRTERYISCKEAVHRMVSMRLRPISVLEALSLRNQHPEIRDMTVIASCPYFTQTGGALRLKDDYIRTRSYEDHGADYYYHAGAPM